MVGGMGRQAWRDRGRREMEVQGGGRMRRDGARWEREVERSGKVVESMEGGWS